MTSIPADLVNRLRQAFLDCSVFDSDVQLQAFLTDDSLSPWRNSIPQATSRSERVDALIDHLRDKCRGDTGDHALVLFLRAMQGKIDLTDEYRQHLTTLTDELAGVLASDTSDEHSSSKTREADRSGGVNIHATTVNIYGDVAGRDKTTAAKGAETPQPEGSDSLLQASSRRAKFFICYKRNADPDERLARYLHEFLTTHGHEVFIDGKLRAGEAWLEEIDHQIRTSDFLIALLSRQSADSEMVRAEVKRAYEYRKRQGHPHTLPVRVAYEGLLPYAVDAFLDPLQYTVWQTDSDYDQVAQDILAAIEAQLPNRVPVQIRTTHLAEIAVSEDGRVLADHSALSPPSPEFDPRFLEELDAPGGAVKLGDRFYIERDEDAHLKREIVRAGTTTTIRASRQSGKSSLLARGTEYARSQDAKVVSLDLQYIDKDYLTTLDVFLKYLAELIVRKLQLDLAEVDRAWSDSRGPKVKLTSLLEDYVLPMCGAQVVLALDEADQLLETLFYEDFFALMRAWHNSRASDETWRRLNVVMVISTEPYLLIPDANQSPFNVGLKLYLKDFNESQARDLNRRHRSPVQETNFTEFMSLLSGHPYLTRKALYAMLIEHRSWADVVRTAAADDGPFGDHLRRYHWLLRDESELKDALKHIIRHNRCPDEMLLFRLLRAGLVKGSGDYCACRCDLYRRYFEDKL